MFDADEDVKGGVIGEGRATPDRCNKCISPRISYTPTDNVNALAQVGGRCVFCGIGSFRFFFLDILNVSLSLKKDKVFAYLFTNFNAKLVLCLS